ncbi:MAG: ABC transporter permease [Rubellimicrobium sp.]|nr:ABC transporter permease [Rubellimicrobium sp.]
MALLLFAGFTVTLDGFLSAANLLNIVRSVSVLGVLAAGMAIVVIGRGIDLSMISIMVVTVAIQLQVMHGGWSTGAAMALAVAIALGLGAMNGYMVAYAGVSALFATLASGAFIFGFVRSQILRQDSITLPDDATTLLALGSARVLGLPLDVLAFAFVVVLGWAALRWTRQGRFLYLMGDNFQAARTTGIPVRPLIVVSFMASAVLAWAAGLTSAISLQSVNTRIVNSTLLYDVILVVVIGGIGLSGGKGGMRNVVVGAFLIGVLLNGMTILNLPNIHQNLIRSVILLAAIILDGQLNPRDEQTSQQGDI